MLAFVEAVKRKGTITLDGYTSNKTEKGIIRDVARAVEKYSKEESDLLFDVAKNYNPEINSPFLKSNESSGGYFFEYEKVCGASHFQSETGGMVYKEGFYTYFCIRIVR